MNELEILTAARERLARRGGWCQGSYGAVAKDKGPVCAVGAIAAVVDHSLAFSPQTFRVLHRLGKCLPAGRDWLPDFNDLPSTRKKDILALFDCAIEASS